MPSTLSASNKATYESIFRHPVAHNLDWHDLIAVFKQLGEVEERSNGSVKVSRNGQSLLLHIHGKEVDVEEIMNIRRFLERSEADSESKEVHMNDVLVVLDHSGARIFRSGSPNEIPEHVVPLDPLGHDKQVHNPKGDSGGKHGALRNLFYEELVKHLQSAQRILFLGDGQGASSEFDRLFTELRERHHEELVGRIFGTEIANISHMTDPELQAKAREFFSGLPG